MLIDLLPDNYKKSVEDVDLQNAFWEVVNELITAKNSLFNQIFVGTSTTLLELWEKAYGIVTDPTKSYVSRRDAIQAKMRGYGTTTKEMLANVSQAYPFCDADIVENNAAYEFIIKFKNYYRVPDTEIIAEVHKAIEEIKPAHLAFDHTFTYDYWDNVNGTMTWGSATTWEALRTY
jgi:uncharacterized protein YmfQ (DUF2313 family)